MDKLDEKIIELLTTDARMTYKQIAEQVKLTSPAVKTRITKLEEAGIIKGYGLKIDYHALGYAVAAFISVMVDKEEKENFLAFVQGSPQVIDCYGITGDYFALLKVRFKSTMELDNFLTEIQVFGETKTDIVLSAYKES